MSGDDQHRDGCKCHQCRKDDVRLDRAIAEMRGNRPVKRRQRDVGWPEPPGRSPSAGETATGQLAGDCALVKTDRTGEE